MKHTTNSNRVFNSALRIDSPLNTPSALNFRPPTFPPPKGFPWMVDRKGEVVSRFGEPTLRLDPWSGVPSVLDFGDGIKRSKGSSPRINSENADLLRIIVAFYIWGPMAVRTAVNLKAKFRVIRKVAELCSKNNIHISELKRYPLIAKKIPGTFGGKRQHAASRLLTILHDLYSHRDYIGFTILDPEGIRHYAESLSGSDEYRQTPYIPPRIWLYQVSRLRECLEDYWRNKEQISACYQFCIDAYANNFGPIKVGKNSSAKRPFQDTRHTENEIHGKYYGPFELTAGIFGIHELLERWTGPFNRNGRSDISKLTKYLALITACGIAYILNFSLMRSSEAYSLRIDCLLKEIDEMLGLVYVLRGETSKTQSDSDARWPTSPSVELAVECLADIAKMRLLWIIDHPISTQISIDATNPHLVNRAIEPWSIWFNRDRLDVQPESGYLNYIFVENSYLFDLNALRITKQDFNIARMINPTLNTERYAVGQIWRFSNHQYRRTGSVNMQASGIVSSFSLQYLLKHSTVRQTLYYGQNFSKLRLNEEARGLYLKTMYELVGLELSQLKEDRYKSPHGKSRKKSLLEPISPMTAQQLSVAAQNGEVVSPREILLGYCMNRDPCPFGGVDSIAHCGGGDSGTPCLEVLYDEKKIQVVKKLDTLLKERIANAPAGSPLKESLQCQRKSARNFLLICETSPKSI